MSERTDADQGEAGRALDARVEREVFGRRTRHRPDAWHPALVWDFEVRDGVWSSNLLHYSTQIGAAWLVVEAMRERGWACSIDVEGSASESCVGVMFISASIPGPEGVVDAHAATAPVAICRASLAALAATDTPEVQDG